MIKKTTNYGFLARGEPPSGQICFINHPELLADGQECRAIIEPDPTWQFSQLSKGARGTLLARGRTQDGKISEWVMALAFLAMPEKPEYLRERILEGSRWAAEIKIMNLLKDEMEVSHLSLAEEFKKSIALEIVDLIECNGSKGLDDLHNLLKLIEKKSQIFTQVPISENSPITSEERDFCDVLASETCKVGDLPKQKDAREAWIAKRAGRNGDQFNRIRDRLGFKWLPTGARGKGRI